MVDPALAIKLRVTEFYHRWESWDERVHGLHRCNVWLRSREFPGVVARVRLPAGATGARG